METALINMSLPNHTASYMLKYCYKCFGCGSLCRDSHFYFSIHFTSRQQCPSSASLDNAMMVSFSVCCASVLPLCFLANHTSSLPEQALIFCFGKQETLQFPCGQAMLCAATHTLCAHGVHLGCDSLCVYLSHFTEEHCCSFPQTQTCVHLTWSNFIFPIPQTPLMTILMLSRKQ